MSETEQKLIKATAELLSEQYSGTIRNHDISVRAGVASTLINYHAGSQENMLLMGYDYLYRNDKKAYQKVKQREESCKLGLRCPHEK